MSFVPNPLTVKCTKFFLEKYRKEGLPEWVLQFDGPFKELGLEKTCHDLLTEPFMLLWQRWAKKAMKDGLGTMVVPQVYFERTPGHNPHAVMKFVLFLSRPEETLKFGRSHVSKDDELSPVSSKHVVNVSNINEWKMQRRHMADAFLPLGPLTKSVSTLETMSDQMVINWHKEMDDNNKNVLDIREWMHHTAFGMFVACMMGDDRAFSPVPDADPLDLHIDLYNEYLDDVPFDQSTPLHSLSVRSIFNLENVGNASTPKVQQLKFVKAMSYIGKLINRGEQRKEGKKLIGPLMERILELNTEEKISNTLATLVAGHDTTAYTMQFVLMELARKPIIQDKVRRECFDILNDIKHSGHELKYDDLPRFELLTKCICETLRMWNVAGIVFPRITSFDDYLIGCNENENKMEESPKKVLIPKGTKFTFWYYGQHHSKELWGEDVMEWVSNSSSSLKNLKY